jgi:hypothetical protein
MPDLRQWGDNHINKSLRQLDRTSWLVGDSGLVLRRSLTPQPTGTASWNDEGDGSGSNYTLTRAVVDPGPETSIASQENEEVLVVEDSPYIKLVHEAGDASAVWAIGTNAFCKVR